MSGFSAYGGSPCKQNDMSMWLLMMMCMNGGFQGGDMSMMMLMCMLMGGGGGCGMPMNMASAPM